MTTPDKKEKLPYVLGWLVVENGMIVLHETTETIKDKSQIRIAVTEKPGGGLALVKIYPTDVLIKEV